MTLRRSIGMIPLLFTSVGCMIGSGWLFGSFYAAQIAGPAAVFSWLIGGFMVAFIALTFAELSTMLPITGGLARYSYLSHGTVVSFSMSWLAWLSCVAVAPTEVQAVLQYSTSYFPGLVTKVHGTHVLTLLGVCVATGLMLLVSLLNIMAVKLLVRVNALLTWGKLLIPFITITTIMAHHFTVSNFTAHRFAPDGLHGVLWALPSAGIIFSFLGFKEASLLAGEAKNPGKTLPIAILGSVGICTLLYALLQIGFIGAIPKTVLANGWQQLSFVGDAGPFAGIAASLGLSALALLIYADALVSPLGTAVIYTTTTARLSYAMSLNHYTPAFILGLNQHGVPVAAVLVNCVVGLFMLLPSPSWQTLVGFQSVAIVLAYAVGPIALLCLRQQLPRIKRPFSLPVHRILSAITFYFCSLIIYWAGWETLWHLMLAVLFGLLLFYVYRCCGRNPIPLSHWRAAGWLVCYFGSLTLISYLGNFGGGLALLPFGWDFLVILLDSLFCIYVAYHLRLDASTSQDLFDNDREMQVYLKHHS